MTKMQVLPLQSATHCFEIPSERCFFIDESELVESDVRYGGHFDYHRAKHIPSHYTERALFYRVYDNSIDLAELLHGIVLRNGTVRLVFPGSIVCKPLVAAAKDHLVLYVLTDNSLYSAVFPFPDIPDKSVSTFFNCKLSTLIYGSWYTEDMPHCIHPRSMALVSSAKLAIGSQNGSVLTVTLAMVQDEHDDIVLEAEMASIVAPAWIDRLLGSLLARVSPKKAISGICAIPSNPMHMKRPLIAVLNQECILQVVHVGKKGASVVDIVDLSQYVEEDVDVNEVVMKAWNVDRDCKAVLAFPSTHGSVLVEVWLGVKVEIAKIRRCEYHDIVDMELAGNILFINFRPVRKDYGYVTSAYILLSDALPAGNYGKSVEYNVWHPLLPHCNPYGLVGSIDVGVDAESQFIQALFHRGIFSLATVAEGLSIFHDGYVGGGRVEQVAKEAMIEKVVTAIHAQLSTHGGREVHDDQVALHALWSRMVACCIRAYEDAEEPLGWAVEKGGKHLYMITRAGLSAVIPTTLPAAILVSEDYAWKDFRSRGIEEDLEDMMMLGKIVKRLRKVIGASNICKMEEMLIQGGDENSVLRVMEMGSSPSELRDIASAWTKIGDGCRSLDLLLHSCSGERGQFQLMEPGQEPSVFRVEVIAGILRCGASWAVELGILLIGFGAYLVRTYPTLVDRSYMLQEFMSEGLRMVREWLAVKWLGSVSISVSRSNGITPSPFLDGREPFTGALRPEVKTLLMLMILQPPVEIHHQFSDWNPLTPKVLVQLSRSMHSSGLAGHMIEFLEILRSERPLAAHLKGIAMLKAGRVAESLEHFWEAGVDELKGYSELLGIRPARGASFRRVYYSYVMEHCSSVSYDEGVIQLARAALDEMGTDVTSDIYVQLQTAIFTSMLAVGNMDGAYEALISNPDVQRRKECLRRFITVLVQGGQANRLSAYPFVDMMIDVLEALQYKAMHADVSSGEDLYRVLFGFALSRNLYRIAAQAMYDSYHRVRMEVYPRRPPLESLQRQKQSLLACIGALRFVAPPHNVLDGSGSGWMGNVSSGKKRRMEVVEEGEEKVDEMLVGPDEERWEDMESGSVTEEVLRQKIAIVNGQMVLLKVSEVEQGGGEITEEELCIGLVQQGLYDHAFQLADLCKVNMVPLFQSLAEGCTSSSFTLPIHVNEHAVVLSQAYTSGKGMTGASVSLSKALERYDSDATGYQYHKVVAEVFLKDKPHLPLPPWFISSEHREALANGGVRIGVERRTRCLEAIAELYVSYRKADLALPLVQEVLLYAKDHPTYPLAISLVERVIALCQQHASLATDTQALIATYQAL